MSMNEDIAKYMTGCVIRAKHKELIKLGFKYVTLAETEEAFTRTGVDPVAASDTIKSLEERDELERQLRVANKVIAVMAQELYGNIHNDDENIVNNIPHETSYIM